MTSGDCPNIVLAVDDVHKRGEDSLQVISHGVFVIKSHAEERRSKNVDISVGVEYESAFNFRIRHS
ncbi:hypothetical protein MA16_Dca003398 [Dendrobium catenatum]|uniref:Uncharacterized protein n=1 Tax=Dendrobium catenatum TaxID=906689 RepID=A0A2I0XCK8_9ASPA|nr:hypothetical protein MA16_Dca003398 [Dendrobium catenatum]